MMATRSNCSSSSEQSISSECEAYDQATSCMGDISSNADSDVNESNKVRSLLDVL